MQFSQKFFQQSEIFCKLKQFIYSLFNLFLASAVTSFKLVTC